MKKLLYGIVSIFLAPFKYLVPKGNIIIIQAYSPNIYCENTKYLFEYLSQHTTFEIFWVTHHPVIQQHLDLKKLKYVCRQRPFHLIWTTLRAKVVIDSGSHYFNPLNLVGSRVLKISTHHGSGPKITAPLGNTLKETLDEVLKMNAFDYVNFTSHYASVMIGKQNLKLPHQKVVVLGYPRCDHFFDKELIQSLKSNRPVAKMLNPAITKEDRIILFTPTFRTYKYDFPLNLMDGFDVETFNRFLEQSNAYFFYTYHTANIPKNFPPNMGRIRRIEHKDFPLFDINQFMPEVDVLLDDYSTTSTDIAIINRPQVFFMPDYEYYFDMKGFIEDYRAIMPGQEVHSYQEFEKTLRECFENPESYTKKFSRQRDDLLTKYYDVTNTNSCEKLTKFIEKLMEEKHASYLPSATPLEYSSGR